MCAILQLVSAPLNPCNNSHVVPVLQGHQSVLFGQQVPEIQGTNSILDNNTEQTF